MIRPADVKDVEVRFGNRMADDYSLSCVYNGAHYHVWVNKETGEVRPTLFKNSIAKPREPGHFNTRSLRVTSIFAERLINLMHLAAERNNLVELARQKQDADDAEDAAMRAEAIRQQNIRIAAVELYDALLAIGDSERCFCIGRTGVFHTSECNAARAALAKAEGKESK